MTGEDKIDAINMLLVFYGSWPRLSDAFKHTEGWKRYDKWARRNERNAREGEDAAWYRDWRIRFYDLVIAERPASEDE